VENVVGIESTIIGFERVPVLYRLGSISIEEIEAVGVQKNTNTQRRSTNCSGMLSKHYTQTKTILSKLLLKI
jgi:hypothetical protein